MKRPLYIASGISVVLTTLAYAHIVFHNTAHMIADHRARVLFITVHTIVAVVVAALSLIGAYFLLTSWRRQEPN